MHLCMLLYSIGCTNLLTVQYWFNFTCMLEMWRPHELQSANLLWTADNGIFDWKCEAISRSMCRVSGPQGQVEPFTIIKDPSAWYTADVKDSQDWIYTLTNEDITEIDHALEQAATLGIRREVGSFCPQSVWTKLLHTIFLNWSSGWQTTSAYNFAADFCCQWLAGMNLYSS